MLFDRNLWWYPYVSNDISPIPMEERRGGAWTTSRAYRAQLGLLFCQSRVWQHIPALVLDRERGTAATYHTELEEKEGNRSIRDMMRKARNLHHQLSYDTRLSVCLHKARRMEESWWQIKLSSRERGDILTRENHARGEARFMKQT